MLPGRPLNALAVPGEIGVASGGIVNGATGRSFGDCEVIFYGEVQECAERVDLQFIVGTQIPGGTEEHLDYFLVEEVVVAAGHFGGDLLIVAIEGEIDCVVGIEDAGLCGKADRAAIGCIEESDHGGGGPGRLIGNAVHDDFGICPGADIAGKGVIGRNGTCVHGKNGKEKGRKDHDGWDERCLHNGNNYSIVRFLREGFGAGKKRPRWGGVETHRGGERESGLPVKMIKRMRVRRVTGLWPDPAHGGRAGS